MVRYLHQSSPFSCLKDRHYTLVERRMPNYANGKIYKIVGDTGATYYGSTVQSLKARMRRHRNSKDTSAYRDIISKMDYEMILIENYPCESKKELNEREGWYIRENPCVNRQVAGRTQKQWVAENLEHIKMNQKKRYIENHEDRLAKSMRNSKWKRSFGDDRHTNCLQRCDPSLFA